MIISYCELFYYYFTGILIGLIFHLLYCGSSGNIISTYSVNGCVPPDLTRLPYSASCEIHGVVVIIVSYCKFVRTLVLLVA